MALPVELAREQERIRRIAESYGLDFFEVIFELINYDQMNEVAARAGFPIRYPHWRFGMDYDRLSKGYSYGLSKIYEMVINNDPCYAYLMNSNSFMDQRLVMCHVYGHCDFFKNNYAFEPTNRKMLDQMANHATRVRNYQDEQGVEEVEVFIDRCLSLENLIDTRRPFLKAADETIKEEERKQLRSGEVPKLKAKTYMDSFINPKEFVAEQKYKVEMAKQEDKRFPLQSERDVLKFLMDSAPIDDWKRDVIAIIRDEAYYFLPQRQTKIMNEGWASYWHSKLMTKHVLTDGELIDYADHHSGTLATQPGQINPYKLGIELFRNIEERWDRGQFGKEWEQCDDYRVRRQWDKKLGLGKEKIFEVRKLYNDVTFIDEFLTDEFAEDQKMYNYAFNRRTGQYEIVDRDFKKIKQNLLFSLTNSGQPLIDLVDANYENRGELLFTHRYENMDLDLDKAKLTLANVQAIWTRPVHLVTQMEGVQKMLTHDGKRSTEKEI
jgi:stage V sporulation protein R